MISRCLYCKNEFKHKPSVKSKYCSRKCHYSLGRQVATCKSCKKDFIRQKAKDYKNFCTRDCRLKLYSIYEKPCFICGKPIGKSPTGNITYWKKKRFCSQICTGTYNARERKGIPVSGYGKNH